MSDQVLRGSGYDRPTPTFNDRLTRVGRGTPMGEYLRRYWHPVGLSSDATETPKTVQVLGEELILFRDGTGRPGLLHPRCAHRGSSLFYGKVEERGIRCCYHGWLFDVNGRCLEQPCEPGGGRSRNVVYQPWYPVEERYGLVFAYLGPPARKPLLPRYSVLEELGPGEWLEADDSSIGAAGPVIVPCNWLQHFENVVDPFHVPILHGSFSGPQFVSQMAPLPEVEFKTTSRGVMSVQRRPADEGRTFRRQTEAVLPTLRVVPSPRVRAYERAEAIGWVLPLDDTHFRIYVVGRVTEAGALSRMRSTFGGKQWSELSEAEHQKFPGDYEAQVSQGPITWHSEEHLTSTDRGIALLRRLLEKQVQIVEEGGDPIGVAFAEPDANVALEAGNFLE
ncbi:MAG TPA: aromatic ring-hydroxylating dioxygenase subunit alpha [Steroidobacter sp.]|uniref:aromatic ring-hydroxylating dioxygenase subunit alpha n=1 Tax=Steroidobacter sp. TaxID=1978227 RepID=UPI002EDB2DCA